MNSGVCQKKAAHKKAPLGPQEAFPQPVGSSASPSSLSEATVPPSLPSSSIYALFSVLPIFLLPIFFHISSFCHPLINWAVWGCIFYFNIKGMGPWCLDLKLFLWGFYFKQCMQNERSVLFIWVNGKSEKESLPSAYCWSCNLFCEPDFQICKQESPAPGLFLGLPKG